MQTNKLTNRIPWALALLVVLGVGLLLQPLSARAATITVTSALDSGPGTLRQAIADAAPGDQIAFAPALDGQTITLSSPLVIDKALTLDGSSLSTPVTVSGNDAVRVFHVYTDTHVTLDSLTIAHGRVITGDAFSSSPRAGGVLIEPGAVVTLTHSAVVSNSATYYDAEWDEYVGYGGGVYNRGTLAVIDTTFADNVAASRTGYVNGDGGAIYNRGVLTVTGSTLTGNAAESGGAIYSRSGTTLTVESSTLSNNSAPCGGSGIANRGTATVRDSTISNNVVPGDWCEAGAAGISNDYGTMTVTHSIVFGNVSENGNGGGLSSYGFSPDVGQLTVIDSVIYDNVAGGDGGGIYNWWDATLTVSNSEIYSNTAGYYGGGILSGGNANTQLSLVNTTLSHNMAQDGGGLYNGSRYGFAGEVMTMINSTVAGNTATGSGGGFYNWDSASVTLDNNIVWGNSAPTSPQIYNNSANRPTLGSNDIEGCGGSGAGWDAGLGTDGGGNIDQDPLFVDADGADNVVGTADDNLRLDFGSPAIETGTNTGCPSTDLDGLPRPSDGDADGTPTCDMGAYEAGEMVCGVSADSAYWFANQSGVIIEVVTLGPNLSCLYVDEMETNHANATASLQTGRYWLIRGLQSDKVTDASGFEVALTLSHDNLAEPYACKYLGSGNWDSGRAAWDENSVTRAGVTSLSDWAVSNGQPTAVELAWFTATPRDGVIVLTWQTASEIDLLGFHVYRAEAVDGPRTRLTEDLLPGQAPGSPVGASYEFVDEGVVPGATYWYWLADVDTHGAAALHGPVSAEVPVDAAYRVYLPLVLR